MLLNQQRSTEVADRIRTVVDQALLDQKMSARRASMAVVGHDGLIRDIRAGRLPSVDRIEALFEYLGLEAYFGPKRRPSSPPLLSLVRTNDNAEVDVPFGFVPIPWSGIGLGIGSAPVAFSRSWLAEHGLVADFLKAAKPDVVDIDHPRSEETVALLDTKPAARKGHELWCFSEAGAIRVAHLTFSGDLTVISPSSAEEPPRIIKGAPEKELTLLGRVVWIGQSIPLKGVVK